MNPYWKKIVEQSTKGDRKSTKGTGKGTSGKGKRDPSTGRFQPRHGTYVVENHSEAAETVAPNHLWKSEDTADPGSLPVPEDPPHPSKYTFITGTVEAVTFAWPVAAGTLVPNNR